MVDVAAQQHPDLIEPVLVQPVEGSGRPARVYLAPTLDGLYTPYALRTPADEGTFPFVFLAYGNGGGGIGWLLRRLRTHGHIMERLLRAGEAASGPARDVQGDEADGPAEQGLVQDRAQHGDVVLATEQAAAGREQQGPALLTANPLRQISQRAGVAIGAFYMLEAG